MTTTVPGVLLVRNENMVNGGFQCLYSIALLVTSVVEGFPPAPKAALLHGLIARTVLFRPRGTL